MKCYIVIALSIIILSSCKPIYDYLYEGEYIKYVDEEKNVKIYRDEAGHFHFCMFINGSEGIYDIYHDKIHHVIYWRVKSDVVAQRNDIYIYEYTNSSETYIEYEDGKYIEDMFDFWNETPFKEITPSKHIQDTINNKIKFIPIKDFWNELEPKTNIDYDPHSISL